MCVFFPQVHPLKVWVCFGGFPTESGCGPLPFGPCHGRPLVLVALDALLIRCPSTNLNQKDNYCCNFESNIHMSERAVSEIWDSKGMCVSCWCIVTLNGFQFAQLKSLQQASLNLTKKRILWILWVWQGFGRKCFYPNLMSTAAQLA